MCDTHHVEFQRDRRRVNSASEKVTSENNIDVIRCPTGEFYVIDVRLEEKFNVSCEMLTQKYEESHGKVIAYDPNADGSATDQKHVPNSKPLDCVSCDRAEPCVRLREATHKVRSMIDEGPRLPSSGNSPALPSGSSVSYRQCRFPPPSAKMGSQGPPVPRAARTCRREPRLSSTTGDPHT